MNYSLKTLATFLFAFGCLLQGVPDANAFQADWTEYTLGEGKLGVLFPSEPSKVSQSQPSAIGELTIEMQQLEVNQTLALISSFTQLPEVESYDVDAGLEGAVQGGARSTNAEIVSSKDISKNGIKGKETYMTADLNGGMVMRTRVYISNGDNQPKIYQAIIVGKTNDDLENEDAQKFLDSMNFEGAEEAGEEASGEEAGSGGVDREAGSGGQKEAGSGGSGE